VKHEVTSNTYSSINDTAARPGAAAVVGSDDRSLELGHLEPGTFLISCGGTGGHLAPGIALAEELTARGHEVTLLISEKQVDARLAAKYPALRFARIPGAPFTLRPAGLGRFFWHQARGLGVAWRQVRRMRPVAVIGFGGFTSAAVILIGAAFGVPVVLHEANRVPGRAVRVMAPLARRVYLPPGIQISTSRAHAVRPVGLPVRAEIQRERRGDACAAFGLDPARPVVAVLGGSQGATPLNTWARAAAPALAVAGVQVCCVTGTGKGEAETQRHAGPAGGDVAAVFIPFCDRMGTLLSTADLVVSRAGAGTIAELTRCETPAVLVPYPHAADNHQAANATYFAQQGGGVVLDQTAIDGLTTRVLALLQDARWMEHARESLLRLNATDARALIANDLAELIAGGGQNGAAGLDHRRSARTGAAAGRPTVA
jgi:UDP-N-acetylglucosamine--N-acetylmuramyl-(pentapeptide) pyrophosphoryl-undecaprenol N-acetylglucosamine transferase